jgi:hypothetical protein
MAYEVYFLLKSVLFDTKELQHRIAQWADFPPAGVQWWEMPAERIPALVTDNGDRTSYLLLLRTQEDFENRPSTGRLVAFLKDKADFQPQKRPKIIRPRTAQPANRPYRNLAQIFD